MFQEQAKAIYGGTDIVVITMEANFQLMLQQMFQTPQVPIGKIHGPQGRELGREPTHSDILAGADIWSPVIGKHQVLDLAKRIGIYWPSKLQRGKEREGREPSP